MSVFIVHVDDSSLNIISISVNTMLLYACQVTITKRNSLKYYDTSVIRQNVFQKAKTIMAVEYTKNK